MAVRQPGGAPGRSSLHETEHLPCTSRVISPAAMYPILRICEEDDDSEFARHQRELVWRLEHVHMLARIKAGAECKAVRVEARRLQEVPRALGAERAVVGDRRVGARICESTPRWRDGATVRGRAYICGGAVCVLSVCYLCAVCVFLSVCSYMCVLSFCGGAGAVRATFNGGAAHCPRTVLADILGQARIAQ
eukprot:6891709-Prymnesium_polylepis.1